MNEEEKRVAAKQSLEAKYTRVNKLKEDRELRKQNLRAKMEEMQLDPEKQQQAEVLHNRTETEHLRAQRLKLSVADFEQLDIIGRGAFGDPSFTEHPHSPQPPQPHPPYGHAALAEAYTAPSSLCVVLAPFLKPLLVWNSAADSRSSSRAPRQSPSDARQLPMQLVARLRNESDDSGVGALRAALLQFAQPE